MPRVMIVAGEASGDLHGGNLVRAAKELTPDLEFFGMGGEHLRRAGVDLLFDLEHMSLMGLTEILTGLWKVRSTLNALRRRLLRDRPAALVLIDYPDFNLLLAKTAHGAGVPVFYYICPQIWAWRTGRIRKMARLVDRRVVVFPFEREFYRRHGVEADFVGHPLLDILEPPRSKEEAKRALGLDADRELLLLMPGSRKHLVGQLLPVMLEAVDALKAERPELDVALACANTIDPAFLEPFLESVRAPVRVIGQRSHLLQNAADAALVASGTSTVETALMLTPMVVVYRMSALTYFLGKRLIRTDHVAMANLIAGEGVAPELIQDEVRPDRLVEELSRILDNEDVRARMTDGWRRVREKLGGPGAARRAASLLLDTMGRPGA